MLEQLVSMPAAGVDLDADIALPDDATGVVIFAHGSGSSRRSPRNRSVAARLHHAVLGTVLVDLLTPAEAARDDVDGSLRFDIELLAGRVAGLVDAVRNDERTATAACGLFGASTGAAAALVAAARRPLSVGAVVSRGGRPDLAGDDLRRVAAPTLLLVGEFDPDVLELNRQALDELAGERRLEIVPGAGHLFEEPGALDMVAARAANWFGRHLGPVPPGQQLTDGLA